MIKQKDQWLYTTEEVNEILKKIKSFERPKLDRSHLPFQIENQQKKSFFIRWFS